MIFGQDNGGSTWKTRLRNFLLGAPRLWPLALRVEAAGVISPDQKSFCRVL